jgi:hypothetical protein
VLFECSGGGLIDIPINPIPTFIATKLIIHQPSSIKIIRHKIFLSFANSKACIIEFTVDRHIANAISS